MYMWHKTKKKNLANKTVLIKKSIFNVTLLFIFIISTLFTSLSFFSNNTLAKTKNEMNIEEQATTYIYYQSLTICADWKLSETDFGANKLTLPDAYNFNWFANNPVASTKPVSEILEGNGYLVPDKDLNLICGNNNSIPWIKDAITNTKYWGYNNGLDAVCEFGLKRIRNGSTEVDCKSGKDSSGNVDEAKDKLQNPSFKMDASTMKKTLTDRMGGDISLTNPIKYKLYLNAFQSTCAGGEATSEDGDNTYTIRLVDFSNGDISKKIFSAAKPPSQNVAFYLTMEKSIDNIAERTKTTCKDMASVLNNEDLAKAFSGALKANLGNPSISPEKPGYEKGTTSSSGAEATKATCGATIKVVGWIMCPIINGLASLNDGMWTLTSKLLKTDPLNQTDATFKAWSAIRNLANIAFAIAFLVIIFSQISSIGIGNYGIKKLLPKLIICAILVNISFFIVQVMVDLANITGSSLYDILQSLVKSSGSYDPDTGIFNTIIEAILLIVAGGAATGAGLFATALVVGGPEVLFWILLPVLIMAMLAFVAALFTLIFRTALIPILAVLAPLAFVAYLLPNTEQWFKKWKDMFIKMLMLYPLAALVFGGARLAAVITIGKGDLWSLFVGAIIMTLPLFSLPFLARSGGDILNKVNGALTKLSEKARNPINSWSKGHQDFAKSKALADENGRSQRRFLGVGQRLYRRRSMRKLSRDINTESNMENFRSEWSRNPYLDDNGDQRVPTKGETKEAEKRGNGHEAINRSINSKKLADVRKTNAEANYIRSEAGQRMHSNLTSAKALAEKAESEATYASNAANKNKLINNIQQKKKNELQEKTIEKRANERDKVKAYNRGLTNNQLRMKELSQETELAVHKSAIGQRLHDNINLSSDENKEHALDSELRVANSTEGRAIKKRILGVQDDIKTAQNTVTTAYHQDPATFKSRVMASASEKVSNAAMAKTKSTIAEMGVRKLDASGNPIKKELKVGGVTQYDNSGNVLYEHDNDGNVLYEYASQPIAGTGMTANEASEISASIYQADRDTTMFNTAEKSAEGLERYRFEQDITKGVLAPNSTETISSVMGSIHGESQTGELGQIASSMYRVDKESLEDASHMKTYLTNQGIGNDKMLDILKDQTMTVNGKTIKLTTDQLKGVVDKIVTVKHQPTVEKAMNILASASPNGPNAGDETLLNLQKYIGDIGYTDGIGLSKSAIEGARLGKLPNYNEATIKALKDKKFSEEKASDFSDDAFKSIRNSINMELAKGPLVGDLKDGVQHFYNVMVKLSHNEHLWHKLSEQQRIEMTKIAKVLESKGITSTVTRTDPDGNIISVNRNEF